jgi:hypothetical protein
MTTSAKRGVVLRHPGLTHVRLADLLIQDIPNEQKAWYLTARVTDTCFDVFDKAAAAATLVTAWTHGRVFCAACEIRWQRPPGTEQNDVLVLSEDAALHLEGFQPIGTAWQVVSAGEQAQLMAWGSSVPGLPHVRVEGRLPKRVRYPKGCTEGRLSSLCYCLPSGEVQFLRLTGVR